MFRDPEKSPGLSLLWGAGPQQRQLPGLPLPSPPPTHILPPRGPVSVPVSVMGSHPAPLLSACLFVSVILGRMVLSGALEQRQEGPGPPQTLYVRHTRAGVEPKCSESSLP